MAPGGLSTKPAPMPRTTKPPLVGAKPQPGGGHSHSQLGGHHMATLAADAAASMAQTQAHQGGRGQMNQAQAKTVLKEAVDAVEVVSQDPVKLIEQTYALISQGLHRTQSS
ncbi:hypothetical protein ACOMHN_042342 [Nucella lapillus]